VATRTGGLPEVVKDGETGLLVPPGDAAALSAAMDRLLDRPEERRAMGEAGRKLAQAYSAERMCEKIEGLYQRLLAPAAPGLAG